MSKSWLGCEWLIVNCLRFPDTRWFIARKTLKNLKKTTLRTFFKVAKFHNLKPDVHFVYNEQTSTITFPQTGSIIDLLEVDFKPSDPDFEDLGSAEYTSGWLEEAGEIHFGAYDTLKTRVGRHKNDEYGILGKLYITCNPSKNWLFTTFYKPFREKTLPKHQKFLQALINDNPKNEKGYRQNLLNITDRTKRQRLLLGMWEYDDDPTTMMKYEAICDLFTNTVDASKEKYLTVDAARFGGDKIVYKFWKGLECYRVEWREKQSTVNTEQQIKDYVAQEQIPFSHSLVDEDGIGGGIVDHLEGIKGFVGNRQPFPKPGTKEPENYQNLRAQCYYKLATLVNEHKIAIRIEDTAVKEWIKEELQQIKTKDADKDGKLKVISKDEIKQNLMRSPDFADTLMMRMYFEYDQPVINQPIYHQPAPEPISIYG